jgi:hypothetical protein
MRARIAWIACLAILFNALVPLVSHAMQSAAPAPMVMEMEVCTAMGMETMSVALPAAPDGLDAGKLHKHMNHCGYCVAHASAHGLPPLNSAVFAPAASRAARPPLYYQSPRPLFSWALAQPRAPPHGA